MEVCSKEDARVCVLCPRQTSCVAASSDAKELAEPLRRSFWLAKRKTKYTSVVGGELTARTALCWDGDVCLEPSTAHRLTSVVYLGTSERYGSAMALHSGCLDNGLWLFSVTVHGNVGYSSPATLFASFLRLVETCAY